MAKCTHQPKVTETKIVMTQEEKYTLELTPEEAEFLRRLVGHHVVGDDRGWRGVAGGIYDVMYNMPLPFHELPTEPSSARIYFTKHRD